MDSNYNTHHAAGGGITSYRVENPEDVYVNPSKSNATTMGLLGPLEGEGEGENDSLGSIAAGTLFGGGIHSQGYQNIMTDSTQTPFPYGSSLTFPPSHLLTTSQENNGHNSLIGSPIGGGGSGHGPLLPSMPLGDSALGGMSITDSNDYSIFTWNSSYHTLLRDIVADGPPSIGLGAMSPVESGIGNIDISEAVANSTLSNSGLNESVEEGEGSQDGRGEEVPPHCDEATSSLVTAADQGQEAQLKRLLAEGVNPNGRRSDGCAAIHRVARKGYDKILRELIAAGADLNLVDNDGWTAMIWASVHGHDMIVKILVASGAKMDVQNKHGSTALMEAIRRRNDGCAIHLLMEGADDTILNDEGQDAFALAIDRRRPYANRVAWEAMKVKEGGHLDGSHASAGNYTGGTAGDAPPAITYYKFNPKIVDAAWGNKIQELISLHNDGVSLDSADGEGVTALNCASGLGYINIVNYLIAHFADLNIKNNKEITALINAVMNCHDGVVKALVAARAELNAVDKEGSTALVLAVDVGRDSMVKVLVGAGADMNVRGKDGCTALMIAAGKGHEGILDVLIAAGCDVNVKTKQFNTALIKAATGGREKCMKKLLAAGADVTFFNSKDGCTALIVAAKFTGRYTDFNSIDGIVRAFVQRGVNLNHKDKKGGTALYHSAVQKHEHLLKSLIGVGAEVNSRSDSGQTALMVVASYGHEEMLRGLLDANANMNAKNEQGCTALMIAVIHNQAESVSILLSLGADDSIVDVAGKDAFQLAVEHKRTYGNRAMWESMKKAAIVTAPSPRAPPGSVVMGINESALTTDYMLDVLKSHVSKDPEGTLLATCGEALSAVGIHPKLAQKLRGNTAMLQWVKEQHCFGLLEVMRDNGESYRPPLYRVTLAARKETLVEIFRRVLRSQILLQRDKYLLLANVGDYFTRESGASTGDLKKEAAVTTLRDLVRRFPEFVVSYNSKNHPIVSVADPVPDGRRGHSPMGEETGAVPSAKVTTPKAVPLAVAGVGGPLLTMPKSSELQRLKLINAAEYGHVEIVKDLITSGFDLNFRNPVGNTALILACKYGHEVVVTSLITAGADMNIRNNDGDTALIAAVAFKGDAAPIVSCLSVNGAKIDFRNNQGCTAIMIAAQKGREMLILVLVARGADLNVKDTNGCTALMLAYLGGHDKICSILIASGADVNLADKEGNTVLIKTAEDGRDTLVGELIAAGADLSWKRKDGCTAMMRASRNGHEAIVMELSASTSRADLNNRDNHGWTALIWATVFGHEMICVILVKAGAYKDMRNNFGSTALMEAIHMDKRRCVWVLLSEGADDSLLNKEGKDAFTLAVEKKRPYGNRDTWESMKVKVSDPLEYYLRSL